MGEIPPIINCPSLDSKSLYSTMSRCGRGSCGATLLALAADADATKHAIASRCAGCVQGYATEGMDCVQRDGLRWVFAQSAASTLSRVLLAPWWTATPHGDDGRDDLSGCRFIGTGMWQHESG